MSTTSESLQIALVVHGYMRELQSKINLTHLFAEELIDIICLFFPRLRFKFKNPSGNARVSIAENGNI